MPRHPKFRPTYPIFMKITNGEMILFYLSIITSASSLPQFFTRKDGDDFQHTENVLLQSVTAKTLVVAVEYLSERSNVACCPRKICRASAASREENNVLGTTESYMREGKALSLVVCIGSPFKASGMPMHLQLCWLQWSKGRRCGDGINSCVTLEVLHRRVLSLKK